jgi:hypothetical protein
VPRHADTERPHACSTRTQERRIGFVGVALAVTVVSVVLTRTAFARITVNIVHAPAVVADHDRQFVVTGPIACTAEEREYLEVTLTQRATGAVAAGRTRITCSGAVAQWEIHASAQGAERLQEGPATAVALARTATVEASRMRISGWFASH